MKKPIHILLVEDDASDAELIRHALRKEGLAFTLDRVETAAAYRRALAQHPLDLILSDYALPTFDGYAALDIAKELAPGVPFIFVTGTLGEEVAIETLKNGATDYVLKFRLSRLGPSVQRALREAKERSERRRAEEQLRQSHEQLRALSVYLQHVREEERMRIARAVHDELGQALTGLKLDLAWLLNRLPHQTDLAGKTRAMISHVEETIRTVRRISSELRPGILDHLGLVAAIDWQANEFQARTGVRCLLDADLKDAVLDEELNTAFFRIFQETLTNVIRHARATRVDVHLREEHGQITMEVKDNGRGITRAEVTDSGSLGLLGMRERATLLGGEFQIEGKPGKGTKVTISIPLAHRKRDEPVPRGPTYHEDTYRRRSRSSAAWAEANSRR